MRAPATVRLLKSAGWRDAAAARGGAAAEGCAGGSCLLRLCAVAVPALLLLALGVQLQLAVRAAGGGGGGGGFSLFRQSASPAAASALLRPIRRVFASVYGAGVSAPVGALGPGVAAVTPAVRPAPSLPADAAAAAAAVLAIDVDLSVFDGYGGNDPPPPPPPPAPPAAEGYTLPAAGAGAEAVHAFLITQDYFTYTCELMQSLLLNGVVPHVVAFGGPGWEQGDGRGVLGTGVSFRWGALGKPILALRAPIAALAAAAGGDTLVLVADAHDSLLTVPGAALAHNFRAAQARLPGMRVLFAAERSCFPITEDECARFPYPPPGLPYRMLNSGGWMGAAADILDVLDAVELMYPSGIDAAETNDQAALQYLFLDKFARTLLGLALDYDGSVFMCAHMAARELRPHPRTPGRMCNALSGACPAVLHFNGGSKWLQVPIDDALATSAAINARGPQAAALRRQLAAYTLPDVGSTFRDFCCDMRWTSTNMFNKVSVRSMRCARGDGDWAGDE